MSEWVEFELSEVVDIKHGFAYKGEFFCDEDTHDVVLTPGNFRIGGGFKGDKFKFYNGPVVDDYVLQEGDLLVTMTDLSKAADTLGYPALVPKITGYRFHHNQRLGLVTIRDQKSFDKVFIYYLLCSAHYQNQIVATATGSTVKHTSPTRIGQYKTKFPTICIQNRIGQILKSLDDKIALNRKLNETLEGMARALFQSWFVDFDPVKAKLAALRHSRDAEKACMAALSGKLRIRPGKPKPDSLDDQLPTVEELDAAIAELDSLAAAQLESLSQTASHFPSDFQDNELGLIPQGWVIKSVEELVQRLKVGKKFTKDNILETGKTPIFEQGEKILMGFHNGAPDVNASRLSPAFIFGDHTCVTHISLAPFSVGPNVIPLKASERDGFWTYHAIRDLQSFQEYRRHWMEFKIKQVEVPSMILSEGFGRAVRECHNLIESLCAESRTLAELRDALLPKLLSGELSVKRIEDIEKGIFNYE